MIAGSARLSSAVPGMSRRETSAASARNGVCTRNDAVATASVGGVSAIVSCSARGSRSIAANVSASSPNRRAWTSATGATSEAAAASAGTRLRNSLRRLERLRITGVR